MNIFNKLLKNLVSLTELRKKTLCRKTNENNTFLLIFNIPNIEHFNLIEVYYPKITPKMLIWEEESKLLI